MITFHVELYYIYNYVFIMCHRGNIIECCIDSSGAGNKLGGINMSAELVRPMLEMYFAKLIKEQPPLAHNG